MNFEENNAKRITIGESKVYINFDFPLYLFLSCEYGKIMENMLLDEFYILQDKHYDIISEIIFEGNVVGFTASNFHEESLVVELCYILPLYRDIGLFFNELLKLNALVNQDLWLYMPNRFAIESLLKHGLAVKVNDFLVSSNFLLCFSDSISDDIKFSTCFYDLRICGCVDLESGRISPLLDVDVICFNADYYRDFVLNDDYFEEISETIR